MDLDRTEASMRRDFEEKMEKIRKTREQLLRQKEMAAELHEHYAALQRSANQTVDVLGIDISEIPSQSVGQPAVSQPEVPSQSISQTTVSQSEPVVSQVLSQHSALTASVLAGRGWLPPSNLVIPVISRCSSC